MFILKTVFLIPFKSKMLTEVGKAPKRTKKDDKNMG